MFHNYAKYYTFFTNFKYKVILKIRNSPLCDARVAGCSYRKVHRIATEMPQVGLRQMLHLVMLYQRFVINVQTNYALYIISVIGAVNVETDY